MSESGPIDLDAYLPPDCGVEGCGMLAPFTTDDGPRCFEHSGLAAGVSSDDIYEASAQIVEATHGSTPRRKRQPSPPDTLDDIAARALASLILTATADALTADAAQVERAVIQLAADLPAPLEVAAGILTATATIAGAGGLTDTEVFVLGTALEEQAVEESTNATDGDDPPDVNDDIFGDAVDDQGGLSEVQLTNDEPTERGDDDEQEPGSIDH